MDERKTFIWKIIENVWEASGAWPQLTEAMRLALSTQTTGGRDPEAFMTLPGLCCQAAGGQASWADPLAGAWLMFYTAAHLMDSLEDQDEPDAWWASLGPGAALHVATGLFFSASLALQQLHEMPLDRKTVEEAIYMALQPFMRMSSGQYAEFLSPARTLDEYWRVAEAKSGEFFALACRSGARLATARPEMLDGLGQFGMNAGVLVQILDDLADYRDLVDETSSTPVLLGTYSLLALYIHEVCSSEDQDRFDRLRLDTRPEARQGLARLLEVNGSGLYLLAELETRRRQALCGLEAGSPPGPGRDALGGLLQAI